MTGPATIRIDKWLWHARLCKTRSLAGRLCAAGAVELAGSIVTKPAQPVRIGDILTISHGGWRRQLEILELAERRAAAAEARALYREPAAPIRLSGIDPGWTALLVPDDG
ncbi:MAG: ribosome-associated heat shock protein Hsp15 [Aliidongia sp.]|jgi:ribosome-associated heat shock protein Hsp15|nr:ribosome-associated heat shock protein Hsp15 [Aliidongia sp.]